MKRAVLVLTTAATIGVMALAAPSPAQAWRGITVAMPQRTTTATLLLTMADTGRATMLQATMAPGTGASFAEHTPTAPGIIVGIVTAGDRHGRSCPDNERVAEKPAALFVSAIR